LLLLLLQYPLLPPFVRHGLRLEEDTHTLAFAMARRIGGCCGGATVLPLAASL
jgi:hypothetical protein